MFLLVSYEATARYDLNSDHILERFTYCIVTGYEFLSYISESVFGCLPSLRQSYVFYK